MNGLTDGANEIWPTVWITHRYGAYFVPNAPIAPEQPKPDHEFNQEPFPPLRDE